MFLNPWYGQVGADQAADDVSASAPQSTADRPQASPNATAASASVAIDESLSPALVDEAGAASLQSSDPIAAIQRNLKSGWTAHLNHEGRLFYCK